MKRPLLIVMCCLILPTLIFAQADSTTVAIDEMEVPGTWEVVASGGWTFPYEPAQFNDHFKTNFNFGAGIAYLFPPGEKGSGEVSFLLHYYNVLFTRSGFRTANGLPINAKVTGYPGDVYTAMVQFRGVLATPESSVRPYFATGIGFFHIALPALGLENGATLYEEYEKSSFGWTVGLGVDVRVSERLTLFGEGKFLLGVTETNGHKLISAGGGVRIKI